MDNKLILINAITLLYRESQLQSSVNSANIINKIIEDIALPEASTGEFGTERDMLYALKQIAQSMCGHDYSHQYVQAELLQKIRHAVRDEEFLFNSFKDGICPDLDEDSLKRFVKNLRFTLTEYNREKKINEILSRASMQLKFKRETIKDLDSFMLQVSSELSEYQRDVGAEIPGLVDSVNFDDLENLEKIFSTTQDLNNDEGIMRFGWQGLNRMMQGGLRRGEFIVVPALQHNFKSGFTLSLFKHIALYNKPYMINPAKKPLLLRISFEDPLTLNLPFLYRNIYENKTGQAADIQNTSVSEMARYVKEEMQVNGYHIKLMHINPSQWTYLDIINCINTLESEGYEIHLCMLDYLAMVPRTGCISNGPTGSDMRDLYRRMRNFFSSKKIACVTPHQMSTEAKQLIRNGMDEHLLRDVVNKGYYDGCRTIDQEVDAEIYIHIVKADGRSFLMIHRGKHRVIKQTPERYKSCTLPFYDIGDIRDDINGPDSTLKKPGGIPLSEGGEEKRTFWDFSADESFATP